MGFAENKKLAKDINTVNTECADRLGALMTQMSGRMDTANRILEGIASEEMRTVYKPSVSGDDIVLRAQSKTLSVMNMSADQRATYELPNVFQAKNNGTVTLYASWSWRKDAGGKCRVVQIEPIKSEICSLTMCTSSIENNASSMAYMEFNVVEGGIYQIVLDLWANSEQAYGSSVTATVSIRAIEETITGTKTQYYYPAEGAPKIADVQDEIAVSSYTPVVMPDIFVAEYNGSVCLKANIQSVNYHTDSQLFVQITDGEQTQVFTITTGTNVKLEGCFKFGVIKGKSYSLSLSGSHYDDKVIITDMVIAGVLITAPPLIVQFELLAEPVLISQTNKVTSCVLQKLPDTINIGEFKYMIASSGAVYPNKNDYAQMGLVVLYDLLASEADYYFESDYVSGHGAYQGGKIGQTTAESGNYNYYVNKIDGEVVITATVSHNIVSNLASIAGLAKDYCPICFATLY